MRPLAPFLSAGPPTPPWLTSLAHSSRSPRPAQLQAWLDPTETYIMTTVLVVEDDPDIRDLERAVLEFGGYSVTLAGNGVEALHYLEHARPDVIILDVMMPVMDGLTFLAERSRRGLAASVPVLCVSAAGRDMTAHALRLGANECIPKPTDVDTLCDRVRHYSTGPH